jgi:glycosyltransferase involved in cell wall biosynthesis
MGPLRVTLVSTATKKGGALNHVVELARGLRGQGVAVTLAHDPSAYWVSEIALAEGFDTMTPWASVTSATDIWHVHLHDTFEKNACALMARRHSFGATVATEHLPHNNASDPTLLPQYRRSPGAHMARTIFKRFELAMLDATVVPSRRSAGFMTRRYGLADDALDVVPLGLRVPPTPARWPASPRVLAAGAFIQQKGFDVLIEALRYSRRQWVLELLGDGAARERLETKARAIAPERVVVRPWCEDVPGRMAHASVVCLPSRWENLPIVAIEAMFAGKPIVASAVDGLTELVDPGGTGLLVPPGDPVALADALDTLAAAPERCRLMGSRARDIAVDRYSADVMVQRTLGIYESAYRASARRRARGTCRVVGYRRDE